MPKRTDIQKILLIGSGPIVIGQACEFDYSGTQACKALREEGYQVVLINSNPATIMTDPEMADRTYIEPLTPDMLERVIERERPDALLPTVGGQTALNLAVTLAEGGMLDRYGVELIGAKLEAIKKAEDRGLFKAAMERISLELPQSGYAHSAAEAWEILPKIGFPVIIRPSFTLGGTGGNIAYNRQEFQEYIEWGLQASPIGEILIEESIIGWKEFELEVMRDLKDNVVIICSIENFDPMGVHTGDSITVAPAQTLSDKEYQIMRNAAIAIIREIGVETGGSNIQFAVDPRSGRLAVIEMNPRVSRSSALASKATGFPIAKIAAKLAVGYTLDEIPNDITRETPASFEPTIDYCVVKFPRFAFEKFPQADQTLTTQMKSVGEVMAIGRTFKEALQKAIRSLEIDRYGLETPPALQGLSAEQKAELLREGLRVPNWERVWHIAEAFRSGWEVERVHELTGIDSWFLHNIREIVELEEQLRSADGRQLLTACLGASPASSLQTGEAPDAPFGGELEIADWKLEILNLQFPISNLQWSEATREDFRLALREAKEYGFSDRRLAQLWGVREGEVRKLREAAGIRATFNRVDTCAAEFEAYTPYLYSTYERECEARPTDRKKIVILGGGPNRIGQGIEFDYCCVHAAYALKELGYETLMVNCNPETVSTDYDTSDRLYFEPLTLEDVLNIVSVERPEGVIVQFGGQTPLKLAIPLERAGVRILGTSPDSIDRAEDRQRFKLLLEKLGLRQPESGTALSFEAAREIAEGIGYPVLVRPSYVLGGRAMEIVHDEVGLEKYMARAVTASPEHPVLIDKFLQDAIEVDVDAIADRERVVIGGIMEHIEEAGIHSGDSACSLPPYSLSADLIDQMREQTHLLARELGVIGLINLQFAIQGQEVYILEVNPRASRTIPFVSKAIGVPLAKLAAKVMAGVTLERLGFTEEKKIQHIAVKEAVFPFIKFPGVDTLLGPEMKSTGEVMGIDWGFGQAFAKSQLCTDGGLPRGGTVFLSVKDEDKQAAVEIARQLVALGFQIVATRGTAAHLRAAGIEAQTVLKVIEGRPNIVDRIKNGEISLVINTPSGRDSQRDSYSIRRAALVHHLPYCTTIPGSFAAAQGIKAVLEGKLAVLSLQEYHRHAAHAELKIEN